MAVKKNDSPLLIIGLGGTGSEAAYSVKKAFQERLELAPGSDCPPRTRFLIIDTDENEQAKHGWSNREFINIAGNWQDTKDGLRSEMKKLAEFGMSTWLEPLETVWLDPRFKEDFLWEESDGPSTEIRQFSRLLLFKRADVLRTKIREAVSAVCAMLPGGDLRGKLQVRVLSGLSGGMGSGTVLDVSYLVRYVLEHDMYFDRRDYSLEGMLVMPDVTIAHLATGNPERERLWKANAYAALKEIDFWMNYAVHHHKYTQRYSDNLTVDWNDVPFNDLVLLNAANLSGTIIANPHEHIMQVIAEYMICCFSTSGNDGVGDAKEMFSGRGAMSYDAMRSNELGLLMNIRKKFFVPYRYRSIGAFSNAGEEADIRNRQWDLILGAAIERMDANAPRSDETARADFLKECIGEKVGCAAGSMLRRMYGNRHPIPDAFDSMTISELKAIPYLAAPHTQNYAAYKLDIDQAEHEDKRMLVESGKEILHNAFMEIACDLERGPECCLALLTYGTEGLLQALTEEMRVADKNQQDSEHFAQVFSAPAGRCEEEYKEIMGLGWPKALIRGAYLLENYKKDIHDLYTAAQSAGYCRALKEVLPELALYATSFAERLDDMCRGLRALRKEYSERVRAADGTVMRLLDSARVDGGLRDAFDGKLRRDALVQTAFQNVANAADEAMRKNLGPLPEQEAAKTLQNGMERARSACFSEIDSMGIESKLCAFGPMDDTAIDVYAREVIAPIMMRSATPMFHTKYWGDEMDRNIIPIDICTVPANALNIQKGVMDYAHETGNCACLMDGEDPNRLAWMTSAMGMPLLACANLEDMYEAYQQLKYRNQGKGIHLCMSPVSGLDDPMRQDWSLLPEPIVKRSVKLSEAEREARSFYTTRPLGGAYNELAKEDRVLSIDVRFAGEGDDLVPSATIQWKCLRPMGGADSITEALMGDAIEAVLAGKIGLAEKVEALQALRNSYDVEDITPDRMEVKAEAWADVLGIGKEVDAPIRMDCPRAEQDRLKSAWVQCYERAAFEYVSRNPQLLGRMRQNQACFDLIDARIAELNAVNADE